MHHFPKMTSVGRHPRDGPEEPAKIQKLDWLSMAKVLREADPPVEGFLSALLDCTDESFEDPMHQRLLLWRFQMQQSKNLEDMISAYTQHVKEQPDEFFERANDPLLDVLRVTFVQHKLHAERKCRDERRREWHKPSRQILNLPILESLRRRILKTHSRVMEFFRMHGWPQTIPYLIDAASDSKGVEEDLCVFRIPSNPEDLLFGVLKYIAGVSAIEACTSWAELVEANRFHFRFIQTGWCLDLLPFMLRSLLHYDDEDLETIVEALLTWIARKTYFGVREPSIGEHFYGPEEYENTALHWLFHFIDRFGPLHLDEGMMYLSILPLAIDSLNPSIVRVFLDMASKVSFHTVPAIIRNGVVNHAIRSKHYEIVDMYLRSGIVSADQEFHRSMLETAFLSIHWEDRSETDLKLFSLVCDFVSLDINDPTIIDLALAVGNEFLLSFLFKRGMDRYKTLDAALAFGKPSVVQWLSDQGIVRT